MSDQERQRTVRKKLDKEAKRRSITTEDIFNEFARERFLYRISQSPLVDKLVLKGGLLILHWAELSARPTRDIDLAYMEDIALLSEVADSIKQALAETEEEDGVRFDDATFKASIDKHLVRISVKAFLGKMHSKVQVDIGSFDDVYPGISPQTLDPVLKDDSIPEVTVNCYTRESVISEKLQAMVKLGGFNSRMKDFYDILMLSRLFSFNGLDLSTAIARTFEKRSTELLPIDEVLDEDLVKNRSEYWRSNVPSPENTLPFKSVLASVSDFLGPCVDALIEKKPFLKQWKPGEGWTTYEE